MYKYSLLTLIKWYIKHTNVVEYAIVLELVVLVLIALIVAM